MLIITNQPHIYDDLPSLHIPDKLPKYINIVTAWCGENIRLCENLTHRLLKKIYVKFDVRDKEAFGANFAVILIYGTYS